MQKHITFTSQIVTFPSDLRCSLEDILQRLGGGMLEGR